MSKPGADKPELQELPRLSERISFLYLEYCRMSKNDSGLVSLSESGEVQIPISSISTILMGPGTTVTHRAMELICDAGASVCWVGEDGLKCFASGSPLTNSSRLAELQADLVSNKRKRLSVARRMYQMRFPNEDVSKLTMQQLRVREGSMIRRAYVYESKRTGIDWKGRSYKTDNFSKSDAVNTSLSVANSCLYGIAYAVICSLGCVPSLGFIHTGHQRSFVYDLADLYKTETSIPVAFDIASSGTNDIWRQTRRKMHTILQENHIIERMVHDMRCLLDPLDESEDDYSDVVVLWDTSGLNVGSGKQYGEMD